MNVAETDTFESFHTKKQYKIYLYSCKICGLQYIGSTTDLVRYLWNNYKDNNRKVERVVEQMQEDLFGNFASHRHSGSLEECTIILIGKTDGVDPTRREEYWRRILKAV